MRLLIVLLLHLICMACSAQIRKVSGSVLDSAGNPLSSVSVNLDLEKETFSAKTDSSGIYRFEFLGNTKFQLNISIIGYEHYTKTYFVGDNSNNKPILIEPVKLKIDIKNLSEVVLVSLNPVNIKEDTIEYKAEAYKVREGAAAEDLLKKLPGVNVGRDGVVTAQGQEITRVRVNGKDYFGGDLLTATRNLPADVIENIQIINDYGEKGKQTGIKEGESEKILNINLKKGKNNGSFGSATLVAGTKNRYLANISANNFRGDKQVSLIGSLNNTNVNSFEFSGGAGSGGRNVQAGGTDRGAVGVSQHTSIGLNYRNAWGEKLSAYGSYSYSGRRNRTLGESFQQDINAKNISSIRSSNESNVNGYNHRITWNLEYKMDSLNYVKLSPYVSSASSENTYKSQSEYTKPGYSTQSMGSAGNGDAAPAWGSELFYVHRFKKQRRNFNVTGTINHSTRTQERDVSNTFYNVDSSFTPPVASYNEQNQLIGNSKLQTAKNLRVSFVEPMHKNASLELNYAWSQSRSESLREVNEVDQLTGEKIKNVSQSNDYSYTFNTNRLGLTYYGFEKRFNYSLGVAGQPTVLTGTDDRRNIITRVSNFNFAPSARFVYNLPRNQSLTATYGGASREPGFTQLQPVIDSSNLKTIIKGNPNLSPEFTNRFRLQYSKAGIITGRSLFANISFDETQNKIVTARANDVNGTGRTLSYLNTNGFYGFNGNISMSQPFSKKRFVLSVNASGNFDNNISFSDNQKNTGHNWTLRPEILLRIDFPDKIDISLSAGYTFNKNTTRYATYTYASKVQTLNVGINGKNYFLKDWTFGYDLTKNMYFGYLKSFNASPTLLNLFVERRFLKNNKGLFRLQGFDLFDQNTGISRSINGITITDVQSNRLSRYFLVSFNYRLQRFGGK